MFPKDNQLVIYELSLTEKKRDKNEQYEAQKTFSTILSGLHG